MNRVNKAYDPLSVAKPHTIKKFELISRYVNEWAPKILEGSQSLGIVYIDCMCNCGIYYDESGSTVDGTALRVVKILNTIIKNYPGKKAILYFNDIDEGKVAKLIETINTNEYSNLEIHYSSIDANVFLKKIDLRKYYRYNMLMVYDPYDAAIDWNAITPYLHVWGEVIINHMVSDTTRGAQLAHKDNVIERYEETYQKSIDEITQVGCDRKKLNEIIINIIKEQTKSSKREHFVASFPFYNRNNGQVYNLIHCCSNIKGLILYKKVAWKTFGGKSSLKKTHGEENQLCFNYNSGSIQTPIDENCFFIKDIAKYIYDKYSSQGVAKLTDIYYDLDRHPVFPSDGYKKEIKDELRERYGVTFPKGKNIAVFVRR